jgi:hypothetical protein
MAKLKTFENMHNQYSQAVRGFEQYYKKEKEKLAEMTKNIREKDNEIMFAFSGKDNC